MSRQAHDEIGQEFRGKGTVRKAAMECKAWIRALIVIWGAALAGMGLATPTLAANILVWQFEDSQPGVQEARASAVDSHGNLIITGYSDDGGDDDFYTVKIASDGQTVLWSAREVHPGSDWATAVVVDEHDDVIVTGFRFNGVNDDIAVIKYDGATGAQKWAPFLYNGPANGNDIPRALAIDALDNIYVAGYVQSGGGTGEDAVLFKLSPAGPTGDGTPLWQYHFNGVAGGEDRFDSVSARGEEVVVSGHSKVSHAAGRLDFDYLTIKFDSAGNVLWQQTYDNGSGDDLATHCGIDSGGNVLVTGEALAVDRHDMVTIKYAATDGARLWLTPYSAGSPNLAKGLVVDADGEVYLTGSTFTNTGKEDFYTARLSGANGVEVWSQVFDSGTNNTDVPQSLGVDSTGGLYVTGYTHKFDTQDYDFQTLKYNKANGNQIWQQAQDGPPAGGNQQPVGLAVALGVAADGNVYVGGWSQVDEDVDYFAVKYSADLVNAPTGLSLTVVSANRIDLAWADNSADPRNEDNFCVERCQGFACADFVELTCAIPQNQTTYSDTTVSRDAWYSYRVYGKNSALGLSLPTAPASALSTVINYPAPAWLYTHDGEGLDDMANAIVMGKDNNPVATGVSAKVDSQYDYYTVKLNRANAATPLWIDDYDGPDGQGDMGICLTTDSADNVVVSGFASLDNGQGGNTNDIFTIKYLSTGPDPYSNYPLWTAQYNGPANGDDRAIAVAAASDGSDYTVVTGHGRNINLNEDIYLVKYKPNYDVAGQQVWAITPFDRGFDDRPAATAFTPAGNVVVVGTSERVATDSDIFISLYQGSDGALMSGWPYIHDFGHGIDGIDAVVVGPDNSIYVAGYTMNAAGNLDIYVNKFNSSGVALWGTGTILDGAGHGYDRAHAIAIDPNDGEIIVAATTTSTSGSLDFLLLRYSTSGTLRWQKTLDLISHDEELKGMAVSPSGEVCLVGETDNDVDSDVIAVKYDHLGNLIGSTKYNSGFEDFATAITVNRLGEFFVSGYSASGPLANDDFDFVVWKFNGQELQAPSPLTSTTHNTTVDLTWTENDSSVTSYKLYRANGACTEGGTTFTSANLITTLPQGTTALTNSGLNIGSTYCYGVQAFRQATSEVSRVIERQVTTTTPVPPSEVVATLRNTSEVEVCWHDNSGSEDGFAIQRCTGSNCDFSQVTTLFAPAELDPAATATCLVDTTACDSGAGKAFRYRVQAYKVNAWSSGFVGATDTVVVPPLLAPSGLTASRVTDTAVDLLWTDNTVDETDFSIERCLGVGCTNFAEIATISAVSGNALLLEMDEPSWTAAAGAVGDSSGHDRHATAFGGPTTVASGHQGRAASFDGANDYLTSPLTIDQSANSAGVTMMAWVMPSSTSGLRYLFSSEDGTAAVPKNSWGLLQNGASWQVATGEAVRATNVAVSAGVWQHLAVVFAPGTGVKFYLNGVETYISYIGTHSTSAPLTIGRQGVLNQSFFAGLVDEAAVYSRAMSAAEVQKLYSRGVFPEVSGQKWLTDTTVAVNTDYQYKIKARKLTGCGTDISPASNIIALTTVPLPPKSLIATLVKPGVVSLNWGVQTSTQTGFQIERCNGASCTDFVSIATVSGAAVRKYTDNDACFGTDGVNRYQIRALGPWGATAPSSVAVAASSPGVLPGGLTVSQTSEASVKLSWTFASNVDGFTVERCSGDQATCAQTNAFSEVVGSPFTGQDPALQAVWHLEEAAWNGVAGEVIDSSGHGHHASGMNGIALDTPGVSSFGAASFDGVDDYLSTGLQIDQSATSPGLTFMAWVYPTDQSGRYQEIFTTDNDGYDWGVRTYGNNIYLANGTTLYYAGSVGTLNTWHHIAAVFNPDSGYQFYRDGTLLGSSANLDLDPSSGPLFIGRHPKEGNYFAGKMDEIVVLNRPLTAAEVVAAYNHSTPLVVVDASVSPGMTYTYRIRPQVNNLCGDWAQNAATAEITASTPAAPLPPTALAVSQQGSTELDLTWHSNTTSETAFVVERCAGTGCDFSTVDTFLAGPGVAAFKDTTACQGQVYRYRVMAVNGAAAPWQWQTPYSAPVEQATAATSPVTLNLSVVNEAEIGVSWNDVNPDEEAYVLSRCLVDPGVVACDQPEQFAELASFPGTAPGLLLAYRMDEAAWTGAAYGVADSSGNGHHGTAYGGATTTADGHFGRAGVFNGANTYVYSSTTLNQSRSSSGVTMEAWVYPTMTDNSPRSVLSTDNNSADWGVVVQNGKWYVMTGRSQYDTGLTVDLNTWQHITVVFTPLVGIQFYKGSELKTISEIDYSLSPGILNIGRSASSSSAAYFFQGRIDEVLVYNRPLNEIEVASQATGQVLSAYAYADQGLQHSSTYRYKVTARKTAACPWSQEAMATASTPAPPPPTGLLETNDSTSATLSWQDNNGSETGYVVSRCEGASGDCPTPLVVSLPANSTSYQDDSLCSQQAYTYRVWAIGAWGQTAFAEQAINTLAPSDAPTNLLVTKSSEVKLDLSWTNDPSVHDESGFKLSRCLGSTCDEILLPPATSSYSDDELVPNSEYCYQISVYKTASCAWQSPATAPVCVTTTPAAGSLTATPVNTTTVDLAWVDGTQTETASVVERCAGDLASCCNGDPAACSGPFSTVAVVGTNQQTYADADVCAGSDYTYRVNSKGEGLTQSNGGCWTKRAPLTFTSFPSLAGVEVVIPYHPEMKADFSDLRFYDATAHRELAYWLKSKTDSTSATVWLMTGANPAIYLYYGNPLATSASASAALFTEVYDDFPGSTINPDKWLELDAYNNKISQNNGLQFVYKDQSQNAAVISTKTFERAAGNELTIDFTVGADIQGFLYESFFMGWEKNQVLSPTVSGNAAHLLNFTSNGNHYLQYVYEDASSTYFTKILYNDLTRYQVKIVLNADSGAKYYLQGGIYPAWQLIAETTTVRSNDDVLRIGFHQDSHNITIHQVTVQHASAQHGAAVNFAGAEGDGLSCLSFSYTWLGSSTPAASAVLPQALAPTNLTAQVLEGAVQLAWEAGTSDETEFQVERDCGAGFVGIGTSPGQTSSYRDTTMLASTTCGYRVKGHKAAACPWTSPPSPATQILAPPAGPVVVATAVGPFQIKLTWNDASDEEGYEVEAQVFNGAWMPLSTLPADHLSYTDSHGVNPTTSYTYRVRARRAGGNSAWGVSSATTPAYTPGAATCPLEP